MAFFTYQTMVWTIVFCSTINVVIGAILLDFRVTPSVIKSRETANVTIQCLVKELPQFYGNQPRGYFYNERGELVLQQIGRSDEDKSGLAMIRIVKHFQRNSSHSQSQTIAQIRSTAPTVAHKLDARVSSTDGVISDDLTRRSFLQVSWNVTTSNAFGSYRCDAISFDSQQNAIIATSQLSFSSSLNALDLLRMLQHDTTVGRELERIKLWPWGSYGLLQPQSGCPVGGGTTWESERVRHHTESTDRNKDELSAGTHLKQPVQEKEGRDNFLTQHFCIKNTSLLLSPDWPKGSYCINKKEKCPDKFNEGFIKWDEEDDNTNVLQRSGLHPSVLSWLTFTIISYCCRQDGLAEVPIYLPNSDPFYLYRYGGKCQQVHGMNVTEEFVLFDTENDNNRDKFSMTHPDGTTNNVRLELCYYRSV